MNLDFTKPTTPTMPLGSAIAKAAFYLQTDGDTDLYSIAWHEATVDHDDPRRTAMLSYAAGLIRGIAFGADVEPIALVEAAVAWHNAQGFVPYISLFKPVTPR